MNRGARKRVLDVDTDADYAAKLVAEAAEAERRALVKAEARRFNEERRKENIAKKEARKARGHKHRSKNHNVPINRPNDVWPGHGSGRNIELDPTMLNIFTDGSCYPNPGPGGWGVVMMYGEHRKEIYGGAARQTNNTMEMTAILEALKARKRDVPTVIYSDSQYCINCLTIWWPAWKRRGWLTASGTPVKNVDLIQEVLALATPNVTLKWVKGHAGHEHNERVDVLAAMGRAEYGTPTAPKGMDEAWNGQTQPEGTAQNEGSPPREKNGWGILASLFKPGATGE